MPETSGPKTVSVVYVFMITFLLITVNNTLISEQLSEKRQETCSSSDGTVPLFLDFIELLVQGISDNRFGKRFSANNKIALSFLIHRLRSMKMKFKAKFARNLLKISS